ncbi:hypothetical protein [Epilithonimonas xixisoli]|uniref:DUF7736 domain-containing protein n=1 Tax=Epilithonimonas xixisoli TaxID=1476462 RepID=A0A4R8I9P3_9FLAO|nr:hypothetical protein [Epilithonimonas xixisoli]TDX83971.1 hypothetical protein B0I22_1559 [Epilithonimonas xixisoli]
MKVTLKKAFSIIDGRLSTEIGDVYEMLNYIFDDNFMTHQLPTAMNRLKELNPNWFSGMVDVLNDVKKTNNTNDFGELIKIIDKSFPAYEFQLGKISSEFSFFDGIIKQK